VQVIPVVYDLIVWSSGKVGAGSTNSSNVPVMVAAGYVATPTAVSGGGTFLSPPIAVFGPPVRALRTGTALP
jgi:hypothetical protein